MEALTCQLEYHEEEKWTYKELTFWQQNEIKLKPETDILGNIGWWRYNQLKDKFITDKRKLGFRKKNSEIEEILLGDEKKIISKLYKCLIRWYAEDETIKVQMIRWAEDFKENILYESWERLWRKTLKITTCISLKENTIKMIYRWYMTPDRIARMGHNNVTNKCLKCNTERGTFFH